jgi:8-oxo-dGTP pyrophosphatase MutT (NUDIX family)
MSDYIRSIRALVGHDLLLLPTTACLIVRDGELLLQLRADNYLWGLPGGILDIGETVCESLSREVEEETGLTIHDPILFGIYSGPEYRGIYPNGDQVAVVQSVFLVERFTGEPRPCAEGLEVRFVPLADLPSELSPHHREPVEQYREYRQGTLAIPVIR